LKKVLKKPKKNPPEKKIYISVDMLLIRINGRSTELSKQHKLPPFLFYMLVRQRTIVGGEYIVEMERKGDGSLRRRYFEYSLKNEDLYMEL
jgi:hypothetical protein